MPWTFPYFGETKKLNNVTRAYAPGNFVQLSDGITHYEIDGPENGQPVVLVHGFSVPYFVWDPSFTFLADSGFRALRYDLFGRGYSDRPTLKYNIDLFCKQLRDLLDTLELEKINLLSLSMGGPIAATFANQYPDRVERLILIDPSGAKPISLVGMRKAVTLPGFGELAIGLFGTNILLKGIARDISSRDLINEFQDKFQVQLIYKGYKRAILSTLRNNMLGDFSSAYRIIGKLDIPTLLFWGEEDKTIPFARSKDICTAIPQVQFHAIADCRHMPHLEKPDIINRILKEFLNES